MTAAPAVLRAIDAALDAVARAERSGLRTRDGAPADAQFDRLRLGLAAQRARVHDGEEIDHEALGALVREVAGWTPESEVKLLAVLGAVVQAARS